MTTYDSPASTTATFSVGNTNQRVSLMVNVDGTHIEYDTAGSPAATITLPNGKIQRVQLVHEVGGESVADTVAAQLQNAVSVLHTSVELSTDLNAQTVVITDELLAYPNIDGRPNYKAAGAMVYDENGTAGIISTIVDDMATIITVASPASAGITTKQTPSETDPEYVIHMPKNMVIMGGINSISVLGAGVADNDIYIQLPERVLYPNYVPKLTVITASGAFEEIAVDVGARETTGFYICARNNDTTAIYNIQVAWEITGMRA